MSLLHPINGLSRTPNRAVGMSGNGWWRHISVAYSRQHSTVRTSFNSASSMNVNPPLGGPKGSRDLQGTRPFWSKVRNLLFAPTLGGAL